MSIKALSVSEGTSAAYDDAISRGGGHGTRTRNPLRGTTFPVWPLAIRLPSERSGDGLDALFYCSRAGLDKDDG